MTGKWLRRDVHMLPTRFSRARFHLDDGAVLHFEDLRLFGRRLRASCPALASRERRRYAALGPDLLEHGIDVNGSPRRSAARSSR